MSDLQNTAACQGLESDLPATDSIDWVIGRSPAIRRITQHAYRVAEAQCTVLISGETGTGKEILANVVQQCGPRASRPFVPVNCAALTVSLAESQLFGHEKGAFTGAVGGSMGVFRAAEGGVVFLDEVGEMPMELQPKLLRVLQQHEVTPVGASRPVPINVQVIAATNRDLEHEVQIGRFREDLYYRLNLVELKLPALRERAEDIPEFIEFFSSRYARKYGRGVWRPNPVVLEQFCRHDWRGNIRQLAHVIEQSYVLDCAPELPNAEKENRGGIRSTLPQLNLAELRRQAVDQALAMTHGHKGKAARLLGIHANTLTRLLMQMRRATDEHESPRSDEQA